MTRTRFIKNANRVEDRLNSLRGFLFFAFIVTACVRSPFVSRVERFQIDWLSSVAEYALGVIFVLAVGLFQLHKKSLRKKAGLACAQCGAILHGDLSSLAISSGNCGECGSQVLENEPAVFDEYASLNDLSNDAAAAPIPPENQS